jgi:AcrR family transcriptional regulator
MNTRVRIPVPQRERRSQVERTTETRDRIMTAVVESIGEVGYAKTTASEIATRAGVTWGAVQYHFGDKDGIIIAVLEESFNRFTAVVSELPDGGMPLEDRVALFIDRSWEHFGSTHYRSTFEILLNPPAELSWKSEMLTAWMRIWSAFFPESMMSSRKTADIMRYTISVLSGLATTSLLEGDPSRSRAREVGFLKEWLVAKLAADDSEATPRSGIEQGPHDR